MSRTDLRCMTRALALARRGAGRVAPNPLVGAVVVSNGHIVGEGYHARFGGPHAEVVALRRAGRRARRGTLYVTLEPCNHQGHTPPCTEAILRAGVREVVCAMRDPHPLVNGGGLRRLRQAGVRVRVGLLAAEARHMNRAFLAALTTRRPHVTLKMAQTLDGKIATVTRQSRWITGPAARHIVHQLRRGADAILVGIETALADDPRLGIRRDGRPTSADPIKVIVDDRLRLPLRAQVVKHAKHARVIVATTTRNHTKHRRLARQGVTVLVVPSRRGRVDLRALCRVLVTRGVQHLLIEGGGEVAASALADRLVDHLVFFISPKIVGGKYAPTAVGGVGILRLDRAIRVRRQTVRQVGEDLLIEGDVVYPGKRVNSAWGAERHPRTVTKRRTTIHERRDGRP